MVRLYVRHKVADYAAWRQVYDAFGAERGPMGVIADAVYRSVDDPNDVTVWHDFATRAQAEAFMASAALRSAMERAGVQGAPTIWIVEPA
jgi:FAD/FMN-containing dehydrogenase